MSTHCTEIGFIGLGRMGGNMVARILSESQIAVTVWNRSPGPAERAEKSGARVAKSVDELLHMLESPRKSVWLMLPSGAVTEEYFQWLLGALNPGDIIIDGANSNFHDTIRRHDEAKARGIHMLDVGVSGGIIAATRGYPMMIGGEEETYRYMKPLFDSFGIAEGYELMGPGGTGHYVKMVHNAIEYGMMQAIAEGFELLERGHFPELDLKKVAHLWNHGTIVSSFLMEMAEQALESGFEELLPHVDDSGEGRWAVVEATEKGVPFPVNTLALQTRFYSQKRNDSYAMKLLAAVRREFGGHGVKQ